MLSFKVKAVHSYRQLIIKSEDEMIETCMLDDTEAIALAKQLFEAAVKLLPCEN